MANRECDALLIAEPPVAGDFRPHALRQSLGLIDQPSVEEPLEERRCTERDLLQYFLAIESSREQAQLSAQAKTEFLATMSHEIRARLNEIIGMTAALLSRDLAGQEREYIRAIRHSAEALLVVLEGGF